MVVIGKLSSSPNRYRGTDVEWKIDYFFSLSETDDAFYCSPEFSFGGETWYLWMQPNGRSFAHTTGHVSLGVRRKSKNGPPASLQLYLSLKTVKGGTDKEKYYTKDFQEYDYFISRSELSTRRSELVPRGVLTFVCNIKGVASARRTSNNPSANAECCHCKWFFDADIIVSHQRTCMQRPFYKCSECLEVIVMAKCLSKHYCPKKRPGAGKCLEQNSENAHAEARIQTEEKDDYNPVQKLKMTFAVAVIAVAVVIWCVSAYSKTPLSPSQPYGEGVMEIETAEINKTDQSELAGVKDSNISNSNLTGAVETKELDAVKEKQISEISKANYTLEVNEFESSEYNQKGTTIKPPEGVKKISAVDVEKADQSKIAGSDVSEISGSNQDDTTEIKESDNNLLKGTEKQCVTFATAIIAIVIVAACIYAYSKTLLSSSYPYEEETKAVSTEKVNTSKFVQSEVGPDESEDSRSKETVAIETEEPVSFINLSEDYGFVTDVNYLLQEGRGVDVTFELETPTGKTEFFAHQLILAVMSSYFADEFYGKGRNKGHQVIHLKGVNPKTFDQMLRYCYGKMLCLKTTEEACALFKVASNFKVTSLLNLCCNFFRHTKIEPGNVFSILTISEEMEDEGLSDMCHKILQEKTREIITSYELCDATPAMVHAILDLPKLSLRSENELINWIFDWAEVKSEEKYTICKSTREYLGKLLPRMNFLALTMEEFARLCKDNPECFNSVERASIYQNIALPGSIELPKWYNKDLKCRVYTGSKE